MSDNGGLGALCHKAQAPLTMQFHSLGQERLMRASKLTCRSANVNFLLTISHTNSLCEWLC